MLRDPLVLKGDKELSFGERKMLDTARSLLVKELLDRQGSSGRKDHGGAQNDFRQLTAAANLSLVEIA